MKMVENAEMGFAPNAAMRKAYADFLAKMGVMGCSPSDAFYHGWIAALNEVKCAVANDSFKSMSDSLSDAYKVA